MKRDLQPLERLEVPVLGHNSKKFDGNSYAQFLYFFFLLEDDGRPRCFILTNK